MAMTLKEKLCEPFGGLKKETANELEVIVDDYAIEFAEWLLINPNINQFQYSYRDLLEIFKKEKGL
jgi:hypothetical protein